MSHFPVTASAVTRHAATVYRRDHPGGATRRHARRLCRNSSECKKFLEEQRRELTEKYAGSIWIMS
jgi:hypothetical protein